MNRRSLLKLLTNLMAAACTAVIAIPGATYVLSPLFRRKESKSKLQRIARLDALAVDEPMQLAIVGNRRDAWIFYPQETIGRVWVVRRTGEDVSPEESEIDVYSSVCPHLGCIVQRDSTDEGVFNCPCHKGVFDSQGAPISQQELGRRNPTPRGMDVLESALVKDSNDVWWLEVKYEKFVYGKTTQIART